MTRKRTPTINHVNTPGSAPTTEVSLANWPLPVVLDRPDFEALMRAGVPLLWTFNPSRHGGRAYVRAGHSETPGNLVILARVIMEAGAGEMVRYRDGNTLNLRRENLRLVKASHAKRGTPEAWRIG